jgi:hypothetical protein
MENLKTERKEGERERERERGGHREKEYNN